MLLETTVDPRPDASLRVRWQAGVGKAKVSRRSTRCGSSSRGPDGAT